MIELCEADLNKCKIFYWIERQRRLEEVHRGGEDSYRAVGPHKKKKNKK